MNEIRVASAQLIYSCASSEIKESFSVSVGFLSACRQERHIDNNDVVHLLLPPPVRLTWFVDKIT